MMTDEISEFLEKIDSEHFNCVYSCNGMTLMRTEEYSNRLKQIEELREERNKYKDHEEAFKNNNVKVNSTKIITPFTDPEHPEIRKTFIVSKKGVENYIRYIFGVYDEKGDVDFIWTDN